MTRYIYGSSSNVEDKWKGIGVGEDDILVTKDGNENLTKKFHLIQMKLNL